MPKIGLTYTSDIKEEVVVKPFRRLEDLSLLKRGFRYDKDLRRFVAPLSLETIAQMSYYVRDVANFN